LNIYFLLISDKNFAPDDIREVVDKNRRMNESLSGSLNESIMRKRSPSLKMGRLDGKSDGNYYYSLKMVFIEWLKPFKVVDVLSLHCRFYRICQIHCKKSGTFHAILNFGLHQR